MNVREFKFRFWDAITNVMDYDRKYIPWADEEISAGAFFDKSEESTGSVWMQWTGLKDKNGVEIYEGDILTSPYYPFQDDGKYNYHGVIEWDQDSASFYMTKRLVNRDKNGISDGISEPIEDIEDFEVIGNIHQNPELLKGAQS